MKAKATNFLGTCVNLPARMIDAIDDKAIEITYETFRKNVGMDVIRELNEAFCVPIKNDWAVCFERSKWKKRFVYIMHHSAIHYIWSM